jgi:hypothetical protein
MAGTRTKVDGYKLFWRVKESNDECALLLAGSTRN